MSVLVKVAHVAGANPVLSVCIGINSRFSNIFIGKIAVHHSVAGNNNFADSTLRKLVAVIVPDFDFNSGKRSAAGGLLVSAGIVRCNGGAHFSETVAPSELSGGAVLFED